MLTHSTTPTAPPLVEPTTKSYDFDRLERYAFCDPAGSSKGKTAARLRSVKARQAILVAAADHIPRVFVLYAWSGRLTTSSFRDKILTVYGDYRPRLFGIEANAMQFLFADLVREEARTQFSGSIRMIPVQQPTNIEKSYRIRTAIEPVLNDGRLFLAPGLTELETELRGFPTARTKDLVDCLASVINLLPKKAVTEQQQDEIAELAAYLRKTGVPPYLIEKRINQLKQQQLKK